VPEAPLTPPGGHHAGTLNAFITMGLDAGPLAGGVQHAERVLAAVGELRDEVIDALFPTALDWQWRGDTLEVLHSERGHAVRDVWYRRGEVLYLESRVAVVP
jgi:hypothetical protein